ncbi:hypothetical protein PR048_021336 [Dryococelus australis]|uniref:Uncharacterized protein n=1 Tax=Dryococelus australis TaxID=614101 RepID=A0ABQ9GXW4_9NEOP|nr:hypothetical protein PR048_021336 [Dryococelus australis]
MESEPCLLQECANSPGQGGLTLETLQLKEAAEENDEVNYATLGRQSTCKKRLCQSVIFLKTFQNGPMCKENTPPFLKTNQNHPFNSYLFIVILQRIDLLLPGEVQGYHWQNDVISIFTAVTFLQ